MAAFTPRAPFDVLRLPVIGRLLRHRNGRLLLQIPFLGVALLLLYDGFSGPQNAAENLATVGAWVHYRGLVVIALLMAGNLFCMGCPFTLPRTLARRWVTPKRRFPARLRNKWVAIGGLIALFFAYEWLNMWASPLLTAWVIAAYFAGSFILEALFEESPFCKYVCPLGSFNFVYSTGAPLQITAKNLDVCKACVGKECVNGSFSRETVIRVDDIGNPHPSPPNPLSHKGRGGGTSARDSVPKSNESVVAEPSPPGPDGRHVWRPYDKGRGEETGTEGSSAFIEETGETGPDSLLTRTVVHDRRGVLGCGTELFVPTMKSSMDCTLCLDCVRACPHDNVALAARRPFRAWFDPAAWPKRWDVTLLVVILAAFGIVNAFGMTPPVYELIEGIAAPLGMVDNGVVSPAGEAVALALIFGVLGVGLPVLAVRSAAYISRKLANTKFAYTDRDVAAAFAPAFVPLGFAVWIAHYGFHFLTGALTIVPVFQAFLLDHGVTLLGEPDWTLSGMTDTALIGVMQFAVVVGGMGLSLLVAERAAARLYKRRAMPGLIPFALLLLIMMLAALFVFTQPMEMRGTAMFN